MYRLAIKKLKEWKNKEDRKPMILMGARQVGKTKGSLLCVMRGMIR